MDWLAQCQDNVILDHGTGSLISHWGVTLKTQLVCAVISWYPFYYLRCYQDVKPQPTVCVVIEVVTIRHAMTIPIYDHSRVSCTGTINQLL